MARKPHLEKAADNILERGVIGPSVTPSIPYDEGGEITPDDAPEAPPSTTPADDNA